MVQLYRLQGGKSQFSKEIMETGDGTVLLKQLYARYAPTRLKRFVTPDAVYQAKLCGCLECQRRLYEKYVATS